MDPSKIFTDEERLYLNSELGKGIGPEFIAYRAGPAGHRFTYIEGKTVIQLLNKFFGFNGWKTEIRGTTVDFCDITPNGQISVGVSAIVRVTLKDGTYHEDIGYGSLENGKSKAAAFEKAKKEAVTDAMKRAARMFGDAVGNCLYDKRFLQGIQNMKAPPIPFDPKNLHRLDSVAPKIIAGPSKEQPGQKTSEKDGGLAKAAPSVPASESSHQRKEASGSSSRFAATKNTLATSSMNSKTAEKKSNSNSAARSANNASTDNKKIEHSTSRSPGTRRSSRRSTQMATPGKSTSSATDNEEPICCDVMPADLQRVHSSSFTEPMARTAEQEADIFSSFTMDEQDELFKHLDDFDKPDTQLPGDTTEGGLSFSCSSGNLKTELRSFKRSNPQPDSGAPPPKR